MNVAQIGRGVGGKTFMQVFDLLDKVTISIVVNTGYRNRTLPGRPPKKFVQFDPGIAVGPTHFPRQKAVVNSGFILNDCGSFFLGVVHCEVIPMSE